MTEDLIKIPPTTLVNPNDLQIDGNNPNKMTDKQFTALQENIKRFGFINPVITNKDGLIADGEHRWEAAKALGMTHVPVIKLPVSDVDRRILRQVLNKLKGEHDAVLDDAEYKYIFDKDGIDDLNKLVGENDRKLVQFMASIDKKRGEEDAFDLLNAIKAPKYEVKVGDKWQLGKHVLLCGDATVKADVERLLGGGAD